MLARHRTRLLLAVSSAPILLLLEACSGGGPRPPAPPAVPASPPFEEAVLLDGPALPGLMAEGRSGDWMLRNERLAIVVRGPGDAEAFPEQVGMLVDAAPAGGVDLLRDISLLVGTEAESPVVFETVERKAPPDSEGVTLVLEGRTEAHPGLRIETWIGVAASDPGVTLRTRIVNQGSSAVGGLHVAERIRWGRAAVLIPGLGPDATSAGDLRLAVGSGDGTSYAWVRGEGKAGAALGPRETRIELGTVDLPPAGEIEFRRRFLILPGSGSEALAAAWKTLGTNTLSAAVRIRSESGKKAVEGARVVVLDEAGVPWGVGATNGEGLAWVPVPPGTYRARVHDPGRGSATSELFGAEKGSADPVELRLPEPARVRLELAGEDGRPGPGRWTFHGLGDTPDPDFGPRDRGPAAGNVVFGGTGTGDIAVPPGRYRLTASRGPGRTVWTSEVRLEPGKSATAEASLESVGVPQGWRRVDLQVRTFRSPGCTVSLSDRRLALRCDGVDLFALADLGWRTDPAPGSPAAAPLPVAIPGEEVDVTAGGAFSVLPLEPRPGFPGRGALNPYSPHVSRELAALLGESPDRMAQMIRPPAPDSVRFEMLELLTPDGEFGPRWETWMSLLRRGQRVLATGGSHRNLLVDDRPDPPLTWVRFDSTVIEPGPEQLIDSLRKGAVVASRGPFIDFTLEGEGVGSVLSRSPGLLQGRIRVLAAPGTPVSRVSVYVNGVEDSVFRIEGGRRSLRFDEGVEVNLKEPGFVVVVVEGRPEGSPGLPPLGAGGETRPSAPLAVTSPIWVEISRASR